MNNRVLGVISCLSLCAAILVSGRISWAEDVHRFKVSGVVKALPGNGLASNELLVKHEEIPDYRDSSGKVVGMMPMTMPFYLSPDASLVDSTAASIKVGDIHVGDRVELEVEQRFAPKFEEQVVALKKVE
jgi:hypothetical protein